MSFPWTLGAAAAIGVALIFAPTLFGVDITTGDADVGHFGGALIVTVSVICMGEVLRIGRYLNLPLALAVAVLPWLAGGGPAAYAATCTAAGLAVFALALPRGPKTERYGLWDKYVR